MKKIITILLIALFPAYIALGHDFYIMTQERPDLQSDFYLIPLGWTWLEYSKETHDQVFDAAPPELWNNIISPILVKPAAYIAAIPAIIITTIAIILKLFGIGPFKGEGLKDLIRIRKEKQRKKKRQLEKKKSRIQSNANR